MRHRIIAVLVFLTIVVPNVQAEEESRERLVVAVGSSTIYRDDVSAARNHAITNGLIAAVSQVSADLIPLENRVRDFQIINNILYSRTNEFIQGYKALSSARSGRRYSVMVEAVVLVEKMAGELSAVGIDLLKDALPTILFFVSEQDVSDPSTTYWWGLDSGFETVFSEGMMTIAMQAEGLSVIDHDMLSQDTVIKTLNYRPELNKQEVLALGAHYLTDLVVLGTAVALEAPNRMGEAMQSYGATVAARCFRVDSGAEIGASEQSFVAVSEHAVTGGADALAGAGRLAGEDLAEQIVTAWKNQLKGLIGIEVLIKWAGNLPDLVELRTAMAAITGVKRILPRTMNPDEAVVVVDFEGNEQELADALIINTFSSFGIHIYDLTENHMSIEINR